MNGNKLLIDTNIALYFLQGNSEVTRLLTEYDIVISFITELELLSLASISPQDEQTIRLFIQYLSVIDINPGIKNQTIAVRKNAKLKLPDAIIAATAISMDLALVTADKGFSKVKDPRIILFEL